MKRVAVLLFSLLLCFVSYADTINLHWMNYDGTNYQDSTCTVDDDLILPSTPPTKYGYTFTGWKILNYIPIEYLEGNGSQYIDTGLISPNATFVVEMMPSTNITNSFYGYGYALNGVTKRMTLSFNRNGVLTLGQGDGDSGYTYINNHSIAVNKKSIINAKYTTNNVKLTIDGTQVASVNGYARTNNISLWINGSNENNDTKINGFKGRSYSAKIYDGNDNLVRDFIPVLDYNGTPCMYDKVEGKFYYNQGTGNFIAGPILDE